MKRIQHFTKDFRFLSNFWPCTVVLDGKEYPSVEHAYQAAKTLHEDEREWFQNPEVTAGDAKKMGKTVILRDDWDEVKLGVMRNLVWHKFQMHDELAERLLATGAAKLEEGNRWHDTFWGICHCPVHKETGSNYLGMILQDVRAILQLSQDAVTREIDWSVLSSLRKGP